MPELRRLAIAANSAPQLADFYRDVFDLAILGEENETVSLSDGVFNLALVSARQHKSAGFYYLGFQMARFESIEKKLPLVEHGGRVSEAHEDPDVDHEMTDPDGNVIGLCKRAFETSYEKTAVPIRHVALYTPNPDRLARFYGAVLGMTVVGRTDRSSIFVSDGYLNLALLYQRPDEALGLNHFGFHVKSNEEMRDRAQRAGVLRGAKRPERIPYAEYRVHDPEGNGIDISEKGWKC